MAPDPTQVVPLRDVAVAAVFAKHLPAITDALSAAAADAQYAALKSPYLEALADIETLGVAIAKYDPAAHNEPSGVRRVSSSDSAVSGDEISSLKVDRGQPCEVP